MVANVRTRYVYPIKDSKADAASTLLPHPDPTAAPKNKDGLGDPNEIPEIDFEALIAARATAESSWPAERDRKPNPPGALTTSAVSGSPNEPRAETEYATQMQMRMEPMPIATDIATCIQSANNVLRRHIVKLDSTTATALEPADEWDLGSPDKASRLLSLGERNASAVRQAVSNFVNTTLAQKPTQRGQIEEWHMSPYAPLILQNAGLRKRGGKQV
jgi:hypothetical protein